MSRCGLSYFVFAIALAASSQAVRAGLVLDCQPDATTVSPGQIIVTTCTLSLTGLDDAQVAGVQIDLPCSLSPVGSGTGTISTAPIAAIPCSTADDCPGVNQSGSTCVGGFCIPIFIDSIHGGFPGDTIFGFNGLYPVNNFMCVAGQAPTPGGSPQTLTPGDSFYLGTVIYRVSDCATGSFVLQFEGFSDPPSDDDSTKIRDAISNGNLVPFTAVSHTLTIEGGCGCVSDADCDDGNLCTTNLCDAGLCVVQNNTVACDDGLFCTFSDACVNGQCLGSTDRCPGQMCDESLDACVSCLGAADCDDADPCTDDACETGSCRHTNNADSCDDGLFCTISDNCQNGRCVGIGTTCPNSFCDEDIDQCVACRNDAHCNDNNPCTDDRCVANVCEFLNNTVACDDGLFCTQDDVCDSGACVGGGSTCPGGCDEEQDACIDLTIVDSDPPTGAIDARQPSDLDGNNPVGWDRIIVTFSSPVAGMTPAAFSTLQEGGVLAAPTVVSLENASGNTVDVVLSGRVEPRTWLTITHDPSGTFVRVGSLPADVNGDGTSSPLDILALIDALNGVGDPLAAWSTDVNRSSATNAQDILREIDLLNGAGALDAWNAVSLP